MMIGYTAGVFDLFHVGHLNLLRNAKALCDTLIVGVTVDELVLYKNKKSVIDYDDRIDIVRSIKYVDVALPQNEINKYETWKKIKFDILFVGDDWYGTETWKEYELQLADHGVRIIYLPYTKKISSSKLSKKVNGFSENEHY